MDYPYSILERMIQLPHCRQLVHDAELKNYCWPLALFHAKLPNGQPLFKMVGLKGQPWNLEPLSLPQPGPKDHSQVTSTVATMNI